MSSKKAESEGADPRDPTGMWSKKSVDLINGSPLLAQETNRALLKFQQREAEGGGALKDLSYNEVGGGVCSVVDPAGGLWKQDVLLYNEVGEVARTGAVLKDVLLQ